MKVTSLYLKLILPVLGLAGTLGYGQEKISYNRHVRPILAKNCFSCHGQDEESRKADLRLDLFESVTKDRDGVISIVPGKPEKSELVFRVETKDLDDLMPPPKSGHALTQEEKNILKKWILEGAVYEKHWAFDVPKKPSLPTTKKKIGLCYLWIISFWLV